MRRFIRSESLRSKSIIGDRVVETSEGQFIGNDWGAYLTGKNGPFVGDNINVSQNIEY